MDGEMEPSGEGRLVAARGRPFGEEGEGDADVGCCGVCVDVPALLFEEDLKKFVNDEKVLEIPGSPRFLRPVAVGELVEALAAIVALPDML